VIALDYEDFIDKSDRTSPKAFFYFFSIKVSRFFWL